MLPANLISALQVLANPGKQQGAVTKDAPNPAAALEPNQQLQGTVQSQVSAGLFKVQVAGQLLLMRLPGNLQSGDVIGLKVAATSPRLTFSLAASTNPISSPTEIGSAARLLSDLTQSPLEKTLIKQVGNQAVWQATTGQAPDSKQLAGALREVLTNSGLFYESHQAQWVRGERSTAQLLIEPQNQLSEKNPLLLRAVQAGQVQAGDPNSPRNSIPTGTQSGVQLPGNQSPGTPGVQLPGVPEAQTPGTPPFGAQSPVAQLPGAQSSAPLSSNIQSSGIQSSGSQNAIQTDAISARPQLDANSPIAKELIPLVQQQLHTLDTHQLAWVGQVWPGQEMQWEIQGQPEKHAAPQDERQWSTEMELALPRLGDVHARLIFNKDGIKLTLHAADSTTVSLFNSSLPKLKAALYDVNIPLTMTSVEKS